MWIYRMFYVWESFFFEMRFKLKVSIEKKNLLNFHNNNLLFNVFPFLIFCNCV